MQLSDFIRKDVQGLYTFYHFEHPNGAFVQVSQSVPTYYVYQDAKGKRQTFHSLEELKAALAKEEAGH